jgi:hypothetical protein
MTDIQPKTGLPARQKDGMKEEDRKEINPHLSGAVKEDWYLKKFKSCKRKYSKCKKQASVPSVAEESDESSDLTSVSTDLPLMVEFTNEFSDIIGEIPDFWSAVMKYDKIDDQTLSYVEGFMAMATALWDAKSAAGHIAVLTLYAKTLLTDKSLFREVNEYINEQFVTPQSDSTECATINMLHEIRSNWKLFKDNKLFKKVSGLMTLMVSLGVCEAASLNFSIGKMKIIEQRTTEIQLNAFDVTDAIFDTLIFFIEGGYRCFQTGSLMPLLVDDFTVIALEDEYINLCRMWDLEQNGNLIKLEGIQSSEFDHRLELAITKFKSLLPSFSGLDKKLITDKYNKLLQIKSDYILHKCSGGVRRAPFVIELFGKSNQGKTSVGEILTDVMLSAAKLPLDKSRRASVNAAMKFLDNFYSDTLVAVLDDMCNPKSGFVQVPPTGLMIDLCNNASYVVPKADLHEKGKVHAEPEICLITTNKKDLDAYQYSNCPYSIQRRCHLVVTVKAKEMFQTKRDGVYCGLSTNLVDEYYKERPRPVIDDLWDIDVEVAVEPGKLSETAEYTPYIYNGRPMEGIGMNELVELVIDLFLKHRKSQFDIVERFGKSNKGYTHCGVEGCMNIKGMCSVHSDYHSLPSQKASEPEEDSEDEEEQLEIAARNARNHSSRGGGFGRGGRQRRHNGGRGHNRRRCSRQSDAEPKKSTYYGEGLVKAGNSLCYRLKTDLYTKSDEADAKATKWAYDLADTFMGEWSWLKLVPDPFYSNRRVRNFIKGYLKPKVDEDSKWILRTLTGCEVLWVLILSMFMSTACWGMLFLIAILGGITHVWIKFVRKYFRFMKQFTINYSFATYVVFSVFLICLLQGSDIFMTAITSGYIYLSLILNRYVYQIIERAAFQKVREMSRITVPMLQRFKDRNYKTIAKLCGCVTVILALRAMYKYFFNPETGTKVKQGDITEPSAESNAARDKEVNPYVAAIKRPITIEGKGRTITPDDMASMLNKNLLFAKLHLHDGGFQTTNVLMLTTNYGVIAKHYLETEYESVTMIRNKPDTLGGSYKTRIDKANAYSIPHTDLAIVYFAEGGSYKDLIDYFPTKDVPDHTFHLQYRQANGVFIRATGKAVFNPEADNGDTFPGLDYSNLSVNTFPGMCGAVLYSSGVGCNITGIHVGGVSGSPRGVAAMLTKNYIEAAIEHLGSKLTTIKGGSEGVVRKQSMGVTYLTDQELHKKSPLNYLPKGSTILYQGSCTGQVTSHTDAKVTPISPIVMEVMGEPNVYCGPKMKPEYWAFQKCLENMSIPGTPFPYDLLDKCAEDYIEPLLDLINKSGQKMHKTGRGNHKAKAVAHMAKEEHYPNWKAMKPLSHKQTVLGMRGVKFMDPMKRNTALSYPMTGTKLEHMIELEPTEEYPHNFEFKEHVLEEIKYAEDCYKKGMRANLYAKATKKDEILTKDKCRIFYVSPIALTYLIRKYFLPLIRFLQMNPLLSECAVGINCHSQEWDQLHKHITKFKNLIGGDYAKYDQKLSAQLISCAFKILITLAKACSYTDEDIAVMNAMASDVIFAKIAMSGDALELVSGGHISGNSLTVIINGICGSLNLRAAFFANNSWDLCYREFVAIMTYGDDNLGSCSDKVKFSIKLISEFLAKYGQEYTMPDKESKLTDFLPKEEFEFLKRKSVYIPEIECHVGALKHASIYKSLHMYLRGKKEALTPAEACATNLDNAAREFFNHGRLEYDKQIILLRRVAEMAGIDHQCSELNVTFDERVATWKENYDPEASSETTLKVLPRMVHGVQGAVEETRDVLDTS